ncbi:hypothetical protein, partial [Endozoicomonas atrinae]|uniref:hypothetical protein n=1 Tax=Endozoicomonas atrinae TaxID=1333660 RepID=UPI001112CC0F
MVSKKGSTSVEPFFWPELYREVTDGDYCVEGVGRVGVGDLEADGLGGSTGVDFDLGGERELG